MKTSPTREHDTEINIPHCLTEALLAFFASKYHLGRRHEFMVFFLRVTLRTVIPFLAARRTDRNLKLKEMGEGQTLLSCGMLTPER